MNLETVKADLLNALNQLNGAPYMLFVRLYFRKSPEFTLHQLAEEWNYCYGTLLRNWQELRGSGLVEWNNHQRGGITITRIGSREL